MEEVGEVGGGRGGEGSKGARRRTDDHQKDFRLAPSGRFQHSAAYLRRLAKRHAFRVRVAQQVNLRAESDVPVAGWLYVLQVPAGGDEGDAGGG